MKRLLIIVMMILLLSCSCSYNTQEQITESSGLSDTQSPEPAQETAEQTPSSTPTETAAPSASPTLLERKDVMENPKIVICKSERMLYVYAGDELCAKIKIALGFAPEGDKKMQGDGKTPEGEYYICVRNAESKYHLALGISYPNIEDAQEGLDNGIISQSDYDRIAEAINAGVRPPWDTALGGEIMIHGSDTSADWTAGCIAASDEDVDYLWANCPMGTPVIIYP